MEENTFQGVDNFLERLAEGTAAPGGGAASALSGAMGAALLEMAAHLTSGRRKYASVESEVIRLRDAALEARNALRELAERDAAAYDAVMEAYALPKEDGAERDAAIRQALQEATRIPLEVARQAVRVLESALDLATVGNRNAIGDIVVGGFLAGAGLDSALYNVGINRRLLGEDDFTAEAAREAETLRVEAERLRDELLQVAERRAPS